MTTGPVPLLLRLNGKDKALDVYPHHTLLDVLRHQLQATEVRYGCGEGVCGTCTVLLDGEPVSSCLILAVQADGRTIETVRSLSGDEGSVHELQRLFLERGAAQCGYCTPGMLLTLIAAIRSGVRSRADLRSAVSGNLCRCTGYVAIIDSAEAFVRGQTSAKDAEI